MMASQVGGQLAVPAASYTLRAPSPPAVVIPTPSLKHANDPIIALPSFKNIDPSILSAQDFEIITQNSRKQLAHDSAMSWTYETRRTAQPILDYIYLGPSGIARDRQFLQDHGITMLLAVRDGRMAEARLMGVSRVAQELGIETAHIDVNGYHELIRSFPDAVKKINDHMLRMYHSQALNDTQVVTAEDSMAIDPSKSRRGRVLVFCESGNHRSAGVVAAYLMTVYGMDMFSACQFIYYKRFCVNLDEDLKQILKTYQDILRARSDITQYNNAEGNHATAAAAQKAKRGIEDTMDEDDDNLGMTDGALDRDRYQDREAFVPFVETKDEPMAG